MEQKFDWTSINWKEYRRNEAYRLLIDEQIDWPRYRKDEAYRRQMDAPREKRIGTAGTILAGAIVLGYLICFFWGPPEFWLVISAFLPRPFQYLCYRCLPN